MDTSINLNPPDRQPIFIHSLFRAGSTYLFKVFRRSPAAYWCYQEPLHEAALQANDDPARLLEGHSDDLARQLRHPAMDSVYFKELHDVWPAWKDRLTQEALYDAYFAATDRDLGIPYWRALIEAARGRPVFQECRTSGRIGAIKASIGGTHLYLWRNPWDQWWSYKANRYFDVVSQLILNASQAPRPVDLLRSSLGIQCHDVADWATAYNRYWNMHLGSADSYRVFYLLWCLGLCEGMRHSDLLLNIDQLSDASSYRDANRECLRKLGIADLDFSDCQVPQGRYTEEDRQFFVPLEEQVHQWLKEGGWSEGLLQDLLSLRRQSEPAAWSSGRYAWSQLDAMEQASRARTLARRFETELADRERVLHAAIDKIDEQRRHFEACAGEAETRADQAEVRVREAQTRVTQVEARLIEADYRVAEAASRAAQAEMAAADAERRAAHAELRATQADAIAVEASGRAAGAELRASKADVDAQVAAERAANAEMLAAEATERANQAENRASRAEQHERDLLNSASWKLTAPLRYLAKPVWRLMHPGKTHAAASDKPASHFVRSSALRTWQQIAKYEFLRRPILRTLHRIPALDYRLRRIYDEAMIANQQTATVWQPTPAASDVMVSRPNSASERMLRLRLQKHGINADLRTPLEARFRDYQERR